MSSFFLCQKIVEKFVWLSDFHSFHLPIIIPYKFQSAHIYSCLRIASQPEKIQRKASRPDIETIEIHDSLPFGQDDAETQPMDLDQFMDQFMNDPEVPDVETKTPDNSVT